jgi:hypothetical protein
MKRVEAMAEGMKAVASISYEEKDEAMFRAGKRIKELPFCALKSRLKHRPGTLKVWVKWKSFKEVQEQERVGANGLARETTAEKEGVPQDKEDPWEDLKFRPISSYYHHFWKNLLGIAARFCITAIKELRWGFHADNPRRIVKELKEYLKETGERTDSMQLFDIKEFFPNVDKEELAFAVKRAIYELRRKNPKWFYF